MPSRREGREELESLRAMVLAWTEDYLRAAEDGGADFLASDFVQEVEEVVYPYLRRLEDSGYIGAEEVSSFLDFCYAQVRQVLARGEEGVHAGEVQA
jgi:hypothetical protein